MSDIQQAEASLEGVEVTEEQAEQDAQQAESSEDTDSDEESDDADDANDDLPDWARDKLTKANNEAAKYRKQLRDAQDKLKDAKTPADVAEITKELNESISKLERDLVVATYRLPDDLASLVTGTTREEMEASAKVLKKYAPDDEDENPREVSGGLAPGEQGKSRQSPGELARKHRRRR